MKKGLLPKNNTNEKTCDVVTFENMKNYQGECWELGSWEREKRQIENGIYKAG